MVVFILLALVSSHYAPPTPPKLLLFSCRDSDNMAAHVVEVQVFQSFSPGHLILVWVCVNSAHFSHYIFVL